MNKPDDKSDWVDLFIKECQVKKDLTQSIFDLADDEVTHAAYDKDGMIYGYIGSPLYNLKSGCWINIRNNDFLQTLGHLPIRGDWTKSLIKRTPKS